MPSKQVNVWAELDLGKGENNKIQQRNIFPTLKNEWRNIPIEMSKMSRKVMFFWQKIMKIFSGVFFIWKLCKTGAFFKIRIPKWCSIKGHYLGA